jgi:hypothetical protein
VRTILAARNMRAFISSIIRWRSGVIASVVMGNSVLDEVGDTPILKTGHSPRYPRSLPGDNAQAEPHSAGIAKRFRFYGARGEVMAPSSLQQTMERLMPQQNDLSRSLVALEQDATLIAVIEMGQSNWLVAGIVPGVDRQPLKRLTTDQDALLQLLHRRRKEATQAARTIKRIAVAYEAGRDGFWLARWLRAREIEA